MPYVPLPSDLQAATTAKTSGLLASCDRTVDRDNEDDQISEERKMMASRSQCYEINLSINLFSIVVVHLQ
jgi:hypothetical protein